MSASPGWRGFQQEADLSHYVDARVPGWATQNRAFAGIGSVSGSLIFRAAASALHYPAMESGQ
jgi:hypothetical protein